MQKVWMVNDPGGTVDVTDKYLYIRFSHSRNKQYRINADELSEKLRSTTGEVVYAGLTFVPMTLGDGAKVIGILAEESKSDKDQAVVYREEFYDALFYK